MVMNALNRKALSAGMAAALAVSAGIWLGSGALTHFDAVLIWYAIGSILAAFAVAYRFAVWAQRPPSRLYLKRGLHLLFRRPRQPSPGHVSASATRTVGRVIATDFAAQQFIRRRSAYRWVMHLCLSGGCTLAFAITFPLVFGWVHFEPGADDAEVYRVNLLWFNMGAFSVHSAQAWVLFNLLNVSAVLVMLGLALAVIRRCASAAERAVQTFTEDYLPLILLFAVTATGLMLTVSYKWMAGRGHSELARVHAISVIALLFYIPFGKLFHLFQRSCALCVALYRAAGDTGPRALCRRCGADYASAMQVEDLKRVLDQLGFDYRFGPPHGAAHYQDICPACRRRVLALNQGRLLGR